MFRLLLLSTIFILLFISNSICQENKQPIQKIIIRGVAELDLQPLKGATVVLYENNKEINLVKTGSDGLFSFELEPNKFYIVEVSKENYVSKRIAFDTKMPSDVEGTWINEFSISVVKKCDKVDYSALKDPVDIVKFNEKKKDFDSDKNHLMKMQSKLEKIQLDYEQCIAEKFNNLVNEGDKLLKDKNFDEAIAKYEEAKQIFSNDKYLLKKIEEANALKEKTRNIENEYKLTIEKADLFYSQNKYHEALNLYKGALILKPSESYPSIRIKEIENKINEEKVKQEEIKNKENRYNELLQLAVNEYKNKNYKKSRDYYLEAQKIKPENDELNIKIKELDELIKQEELKLQKEKSIEQAYVENLSQAERLLKEKKYEEAKILYQKALSIKPQENYPLQKIKEIDEIVKKEEINKQKALLQDKETKYNSLLDEADKFFRNKQYQEAYEKYNQALLIKPEELYPKQRIAQLKKLIETETKKQTEIELAYQQTLTRAADEERAGNFENAKSLYLSALKFQPNSETLKNKIAEIDRIIQAKQREQQEKSLIEKNYVEEIKKADYYFQNKNYELAKQSYQNALKFKPSEKYPELKIKEINDIIATDKQKQEQLKLYNDYIARANSLYITKDYDNALVNYKEALKIKPDDQFVLGRIREIENINQQRQKELQQEKERRQRYEDLIKTADQYFAIKNYQLSRASYENALKLYPNEQYPIQKIKEIDEILAVEEIKIQQQKSKEREFNAEVEKAEFYFNQKKYELALQSYKKALELNPDDNKVKNRINEINSLLEENKKLQERHNAFRLIVQKGDDYYNNKDYENALNSYNEALKYFPDNVEVLNKKRVVENLLEQQQQRLQQEKERRKRYEDLIRQADAYYTIKNLQIARNYYEEALKLYPEENMPKDKIREIDRFIAEEQKKLAEIQQKENAYNDEIKRGDAFYQAGQYNLALQSYQKALEYKPAEIYPLNKIKEIETLLAKQKLEKEKEERYKNLISNADKLMIAKDYNKAKDLYSQALNEKPGDVYSKSQIEKINNILKQLELQTIEKERIQKEYDETINIADKLFQSMKYEEAREIYKKALTIKIDEEYPKRKIQEINDILKNIELAKKSLDIKPITETKTKVANLPDLNFKNEGDLEKYLNELKKKYPVGITQEIYEEKYRTITRTIVIRGDEVREFRKIYFKTWGGAEYSMNGKPISGQFHDEQVKPRNNEFFNKKEFVVE